MRKNVASRGHGGLFFVLLQLEFINQKFLTPQNKYFQSFVSSTFT